MCPRNLSLHCGDNLISRKKAAQKLFGQPYQLGYVLPDYSLMILYNSPSEV